MTKARTLADFNTAGVLTSTSTLNPANLDDTGTIPSALLAGVGGGEDNAPYFLTTGSTNQNILDATMVTVAYDTLLDSLDSATGFNTSSYTYTIQSGGAGLWSFSAGTYFGQITNGSQYDIAFYINGVNQAQSRAVAGGAHQANPQATQLFKMEEGDTICVKLYQNTGSTRVAQTGDRSSFFGGYRVKEIA